LKKYKNLFLRVTYKHQIIFELVDTQQGSATYGMRGTLGTPSNFMARRSFMFYISILLWLTQKINWPYLN